MLYSNCAICMDFFNSESNIQVTRCGHLFHHSCITQWLQRSQTCPQCRIKCSPRKIFRVYFNTAYLDESPANVGLLTAQLDNVNLQLKQKERDCNAFEEDIKVMMQTALDKIDSLENRIQKLNHCNFALTSQVKDMGHLREELRLLQQKVATMDGMATLLSATSVEADQMIKTEGNPERLAAWVAILVHKIRQHEQTIAKLRQKHATCAKSKCHDVPERNLNAGDNSSETPAANNSKETASSSAQLETGAVPKTRSYDYLRFRKPLLDTTDSIASTSRAAAIGLPPQANNFSFYGNMRIGSLKYDEDSSD